MQPKFSTGDGMGVPSITAGRILKGQLRGNSGEETVLAMDQFTHLGLSKVYIYIHYIII